MYKELIEEIEFQISQIDKQFEEFNAYFQNMNYETPDITQITVMASILHSFYTGIESIFMRISNRVDEFIPTSSKSHQELLDKMFAKTDKRKAVIDENTYLSLNEYMKFRHVFRHGYTFQLKWEKMKNLAENLFGTWDRVKEQLTGFTKSLEI